jgi:hypothetical protein
MSNEDWANAQVVQGGRKWSLKYAYTFTQLGVLGLIKFQFAFLFVELPFFLLGKRLNPSFLRGKINLVCSGLRTFFGPFKMIFSKIWIYCENP